jgi:flagellar basal-body rod modification protein FlgD
MTNSINGLESAFAPPPSRKAPDELGQSDFLKLMITQFKNQDPFEPMDNGQFLGQLAQFSTVSGIDSLNNGFNGLSGALQDEQALQASNLVGRSIVARSDRAWFDGTDAVSGELDLDAAAGNVQIDITDASGQLVQRLVLGQQPAGTTSFTWDGRNVDGDRVAAGEYTLNARVMRGRDVESVPTLLESRVDSVTLGRQGRGMTLNLEGGGSLSLAQVYRISR